MYCLLLSMRSFEHEIESRFHTRELVSLTTYTFSTDGITKRKVTVTYIERYKSGYKL